jgi:cellulose synthase/poly-beta-1,6-N-acetylglucosamine synthase-like glycosyltransferase
MTFEVYRKRLGRVAFSTRAIAVTQDPDNLDDYIKQTKRWALGLWQTARRHGLRRDLLSFSLSLLLGELVSASLILLTLPIVVVMLVAPLAFPVLADLPLLGPIFAEVSRFIGLDTVALGVLAPDYLLTCAVAIVERRPRYLLYGPLFIVLRVVDAAIALYTLPRAWQERSTGRWVSPTRRAPNTGETLDCVIDLRDPTASPARDNAAVTAGPVES